MLGMEIKYKNLTAGDKSDTALASDDVLDELLAALKNMPITDVLQGNDRDQINQKIHRRIISLRKNSPTNNSESATNTNIELSQKRYLVDAVLNADVHSLLVFLTSNCYLQVSVSDTLSTIDCDEVQKEALSKNVVSVLSKLSVKFDTKPNAPDYEIQLIKNAETGYLTNNIKDVYQLVEAVENGTGFGVNSAFEQLLLFVLQWDVRAVLSLSEQVATPLNSIFFLKPLTEQQLVLLSAHTSRQGKWFSVELIRQLIEKGTDEYATLNAIVNNINQVWVQDTEFLKKVVSFFSKELVFNAALGEWLACQNKDTVTAIISEFSIDKYSFNIEARNKLLKHFDEKSDTINLRNLLKTTYDKWETFLNSILFTEDYCNDLIVTDFGTFVANYFGLFVSVDELIQLMKETLIKILWIDGDWSVSSSLHETKFHTYASRLYIQSAAYASQNLDNSEIVSLFKQLMSHKIVHMRYFYKNNYLTLIEKNILNQPNSP